jgi:hypothetical protein
MRGVDEDVILLSMCGCLIAKHHMLIKLKTPRDIVKKIMGLW